MATSKRNVAIRLALAGEPDSRKVEKANQDDRRAFRWQQRRERKAKREAGEKGE